MLLIKQSTVALAVGAAALMAVPFAHAETACENTGDTEVYRLCLRRERRDVTTTTRASVRTMRTENRAARTEARASVAETRTEYKAERKEDIEACKALRDSLTVTDGMVPLAEVEAIFSCMKNVHMEAKEMRQAVRTQRTETRSAIKEDRTETLENARESRRAARLRMRDARLDASDDDSSEDSE